LKDEHTYYWYFHAQEEEGLYPKGFRVRVAMAPTSLGPWKIYEKNPIFGYDFPGNWDEESVDCVSVIKEGAYNIDVDFVPGESIRKTIGRNPKVKFVKVIAENLVESYALTSLGVTATLWRIENEGKLQD